MPNIFFLILRRLRAPIITLISIYAVSIFGLVIIPGQDDFGQVYRMDFFHAFYFVSYTATTIGFGEIPFPFTNAQRMWVVLCIYLSVIGWTYTLGSIFALTRDKALINAMKYSRFKSKVERLSEPFYLVCGYGQSGQLLCKTLDEQNIRFVVIEQREERINEIALADYHFDVACFAGNAANPELLKIAGLKHTFCKGVLGITGDENVNLAVAITAYVLRPELLSICRSKNQSISENMASFGANRIINMFEAVGRQFHQALNKPEVSYLQKVLFDIPGRELPPKNHPPKGHWIIVGYGRFGHAMHDALNVDGITISLVDPSPNEEQLEHYHQASGVDALSLKQAGIENAVGIIAAYDQDTNNLSAIATARAINPELFTFARQNLQSNHLLFEAFKPDVTSIRSEVIAQEALRSISSPLLSRFITYAETQTEQWAHDLSERINVMCHGHIPEKWTITLDAKNIVAVYAFLAQPTPHLLMKHFSFDVLDNGKPLNCIALLRRNSGKDQFLPIEDQRLSLGDVILFIGDANARQAHNAMSTVFSLLDYARTGEIQPQSWLFKKIAHWRAEQK
jgi:voltage-gated potassium channel